MNQNLVTLSHSPLQWDNSLPPLFKGVRLPGSNIFSSSGDFGSVCIQEYVTETFFIRLNVFDLFQRFVIKTFSAESGIHTRLMLKGRVAEEIDSATKWSLHQNRFNIFYDKQTPITEVYEKNIHITFDTFFPKKLVEELLQLFPLNNKRFKSSSLLISSNWADIETLELANSILRCRYQNNLRRYFFESRVKDMFFKYLVLSESPAADEKEPTEKEIQAINKAEEIINSNIAVHNSIPDLAKQVLLNEFRLKQLFKKIFGAGPYEYLVKKRLEKGKELLEQGLSVKETAAFVGYRPSDFTTSFRNHFGFQPSSIKKRNS